MRRMRSVDDPMTRSFCFESATTNPTSAASTRSTILWVSLERNSTASKSAVKVSASVTSVSANQCSRSSITPLQRDQRRRPSSFEPQLARDNLGGNLVNPTVITKCLRTKAGHGIDNRAVQLHRDHPGGLVHNQSVFDRRR